MPDSDDAPGEPVLAPLLSDRKRFGCCAAGLVQVSPSVRSKLGRSCLVTPYGLDLKASLTSKSLCRDEGPTGTDWLHMASEEPHASTLQHRFKYARKLNYQPLLKARGHDSALD